MHDRTVPIVQTLIVATNGDGVQCALVAYSDGTFAITKDHQLVEGPWPLEALDRCIDRFVEMTDKRL